MNFRLDIVANAYPILDVIFIKYNVPRLFRFSFQFNGAEILTLA